MVANRRSPPMSAALAGVPPPFAGFGTLRILVGLGAGLLAGCSTPHTGARLTLEPVREDQGDAFRRAQRMLANQFPATYRATHRVVIDVGRRQYVGDGFLTASPANGLHLAVVSPLGLVAEVRVNGAGKREILKTTPLFRASWTRDYLMRDVCWLGTVPARLRPAGSRPDGGLVLEPPVEPDGTQARYVCSSDGARWEELELWRHGRRAYHAKMHGWRRVEGWPAEIPAEFDVNAGAYRVNLRVAELVVQDVGDVPDAGGARP
jgi:hypothetical protein